MFGKPEATTGTAPDNKTAPPAAPASLPGATGWEVDGFTADRAGANASGRIVPADGVFRGIAAGVSCGTEETAFTGGVGDETPTLFGSSSGWNGEDG
jgi:hypothetical protein